MTLALSPPPDLTAREPWPWRCSWCRRVLGIVTGDTIAIKHSGRLIEARLPCVQFCDACGTQNALDRPPDKT